MDFIILTGRSGAGKTQAANTLEDLGYYCIDNMPAALLSRFHEIYTASPGKYNKLAFIMDMRGEVEFDTLLAELARMKHDGNHYRILYLDCSDAVILNRYKEHRRVHPIAAQHGISITDALEMENRTLAPLRAASDVVLDTTHLSIAQLREKIRALLAAEEGSGMLVNCMSFGFKYGILAEADLVFDARCFPNPYYVPELRERTGLEPDVRDYVFGTPQTGEFLKKLIDMMLFLIPQYVEEGKTQLTVAIGCTGGKHRSVALTEALKSALTDAGISAISLHRDILR